MTEPGKQVSLANISLVVAAAGLVLPFAFNGPSLPVPGFGPEWLAIALGVAASLILAFARRVPGALPQSSCWLIAFALFIALQTGIERPAYFQFAFIGITYVLFAALLIWTGAQLSASLGGDRVAKIAAAFLLAGALWNAGAGVIQSYAQTGFLENWLGSARGGRAQGTIGHINLYANYLALGQAALIYLWHSRHIRIGYALAAGLLLACASALSASRSAVLYPLWFAALAMLAVHCNGDDSSKRLRLGACLMIALNLLAILCLPLLNSVAGIGIASSDTARRTLALIGGYDEPRWEAWSLALQIAAKAPLLGVGIGGFAGTAFDSTLPASLHGFIWTSPHNLPLHLLAETGILGTVLVLGALYAWWSPSLKRYVGSPHPATWWILAAVGVQMLHSLLEFPFWNAQFLGMTALLMGIAVNAHHHPDKLQTRNRLLPLILGLMLVVPLAMTLRDYFDLDTARRTVMSPVSATVAERTQGMETLAQLGDGPFGPIAEGWILLNTPLDRNNLEDKLALSARVIQYWPATPMLARRAALLALAGESAAADALLSKALRAFPSQCNSMLAVLGQTLESDRQAMAPLLALVSDAKNCH